MAVEWGRRRFLVSTGLASSYYLSGCKTTSRSGLSEAETSTPRIRKRWITGADEPNQKAFIKCIEWLKANDEAMAKPETQYPPEDPRSYLTYKNMVAGHANACQHGNWLIFPWHRHYLDYFENTCRYILQDENFALPYWDWTLDRKIPSEFFTNPVLQSERDFTPESALGDESVGPDLIAHLLEISNWGNFHSRSRPLIPLSKPRLSGEFESGPHNLVHRTIGGIMGNQTDSPFDPLFWLHHGNIDRIWAMWQDKNPTRLTPAMIEAEEALGDGPKPVKISLGGLTPAVFEEQELVLVLDRGSWVKGKEERSEKLLPDLPDSPKNRIVRGKVTVLDVLRTKNLGYTYDTIPIPKFQLSQTMVIRKEKLSLVSLVGKTEIEKSKLSVSLAVGSKDEEAKALLDKFKGNSRAVASLIVEGIIPPHDRKEQDRVRIRLRLDEVDVGLSAFFGHPGHEEGESPEMGFTFEVTRELRALLQKKTYENLNLSAIAFDVDPSRIAPELFANSPKAALSLEFSFPS